MDWEHLGETVIRMDADAEPPWMGLRRVSVGYSEFMSRAYRNTPNTDTQKYRVNIDIELFD